MPGAGEVVAAGAVVVRRGGREVLLVHRPKYDDWSFPKGKRDPDEHVTATAVREVAEETGLRVRLGRPLPRQLYVVAGGRAKTVHYWIGRVAGGDDVSGYEVNDEIDEVRWVGLDEAPRVLSYLDDIDLLDSVREHPRRTAAAIVVRHGRARRRSSWRPADPLRPLTEAGQLQARAIAPVLAAYGVTELLSSPSRRCLQTITPAAEQLGRPARLLPGLSEEEVTDGAIDEVVEHVLSVKHSTAVCTHRPVLPTLLERLQVSEEPLAPGELVVCHHRRGRVVAVERHLAR